MLHRRWLLRMLVLFVSLFFTLVFYSFLKLEENSASRVDSLQFMMKGSNDEAIPVQTLEPTLEQVFIRDSDVQDPRLRSGNQYFVVVLIHSAINQTDRRESIRNTWLSKSMISRNDVNLAYWFLIGAKDLDQSHLQNLKKEQERYGDLLIFFNVDDSYHGLPHRTLYSMTHVANHYEFTYLLKTDDDVYINTPVVLQEMQKLRPKQRLYWGRFSCQNPPMEGGRWKEDKWHWCDVYYPYAYGGMYVLTYDVVSLVADNAPFLQLYSCEDVSLGMWLGPYNLIRVNDVRIFVEHSLLCSRGFIAVHIPSRHVPKVVLKLHENLKRKGVLCTTFVHEDLLSWRGLPEKCETESVKVV